MTTAEAVRDQAPVHDTSLPTMSMVTAEIPARRAAACQFFNHAGRRPAGEAFLLKRPLPTLMPGVRTGWRISVRAARHGELLRHAEADLITRTTPERAGPDAAGRLHPMDR